MGGLSAYVQRSFTCGLLHSSSKAFHSFATPLKVSTALESASATFDGEFDMSQTIEPRDTNGLLHSAASFLSSSVVEECHDSQKWKVLRQGEHCLDNNLIPTYTWTVLRTLREKGYEAYLVGGSVRDMLLKQIPKDFDVLTTAEPKQVKKGFYDAIIVGKRFPICQVHIRDKIIEVSSFSTTANVKGKNNMLGSFIDPCLDKMKNSNGSNQRHHARWENSLKRDFTINGLLYDPFKKTLYDYVGGIEDLNKMKVRTVLPANQSFVEDSARILRAFRIAARLGFKFSRETARAIQLHSDSVRFLNKQRLMMEMNYMLAYGAAEPSLRLLWRFGILEILLPHQAAYLAAQGFKRQEKRSNMLLTLLANLDRVVSPDRPCHSCLWINLLALHLALVDHPQCPVVVSALALAIHGKKDLKKAVGKAAKIHSKYGDMNKVFPEVDNIADPGPSSNVMKEVLQLREDAVNALHLMYNPAFVSTAMWRHPEAPSSDVVLLSKPQLEKCEELFLQVDDWAGCTKLEKDQERQRNVSQEKEQGSKRRIDSSALEGGVLEEVSFVFSHIVMATLYPHAAKKQKESS